MPTNWIKEFLEASATYWTLWAIWGIAMYLNQVRKWKPFKIGSFLINIFVAWWLWLIAKDFIPDWMWDLEYSIVSMVWFLAFPILDYLENKWIVLFINKVLWQIK